MPCVSGSTVYVTVNYGDGDGINTSLHARVTTFSASPSNPPSRSNSVKFFASNLPQIDYIGEDAIRL